MTRRCSVCDHDGRNAIDFELIQGRSLRTIAVQFGVSKASLTRHKLRHLPRSMLQAHRVAEATRADTLLADVCRLQRRAEDILDRAEENRDNHTALAAIRELRGVIELLARLAGHLKSNVASVTIINSPEFARLKGVLRTALGPFPDARLAVARALREIDHEDCR